MDLDNLPPNAKILYMYFFRLQTPVIPLVDSIPDILAG